jgi:hypothetical protein
MSILLAIPMGDGEEPLLVEADPVDVEGGLVLAAPDPGKAAATAIHNFADSLERLQPVLTAIKDRLVASAPQAFSVEFGIKLAGETGIILAKGSAEVNLKITMTWNAGAAEKSTATATTGDGAETDLHHTQTAGEPEV